MRGLSAAVDRAPEAVDRPSGKSLARADQCARRQAQYSVSYLEVADHFERNQLDLFARNRRNPGAHFGRFALWIEYRAVVADRAGRAAGLDLARADAMDAAELGKGVEV